MPKLNPNFWFCQFQSSINNLQTAQTIGAYKTLQIIYYQSVQVMVILAFIFL